MKIISLIFIVLLFAAATAFAQCPSLTITGPEGITNPGDQMTFRLDVSKPDVKYFWTVSVGTIIEGQGTPMIVVVTDKATSASNVTATVDVQGLRPDCARRASQSAPLAAGISCGLVMDEWEGLKPNDERGRFDVFFAELSNNPLNIGIVVLQVTEQERFSSSNKRLQRAVKHAKFREFDLNRIWFVLDLTGKSRTSVYRMPPDADMKPCDGTCITIKGGDL